MHFLIEKWRSSVCARACASCKTFGLKDLLSIPSCAKALLQRLLYYLRDVIRSQGKCKNGD